MEKKTISLAWAKFSDYKNSSVFGNSILALHSEDVILFYDLNTCDTNYYKASSEEHGNGISCLSGHKIYQIFAIAEKCLRSRILLMKYPNFERFQTLSGDNNTSGNYLDICFSETEILIGLTGYPDYCLKIWNFRFGQLLCVTKTNVESQIQTISCSSFEPLTVLQSATNLGLMNLWEIHVILDEALIIHRPINSTIFERKFNIPYAFGHDGWIYFVDKCGNLYGTMPGGVTPKLLYEKNYKNEVLDTSLAYYKNGCIISDSNCEICLIRKIGTDWSEIWNITVDVSICKMFWITNVDKFYALNKFGNILKMEEKSGTVKFKIINEGEERYCIKYFDILNPYTQYIAVVVDEMKDIILLDVTNGKKISIFNMTNQVITCICSHPLYSIIAIGDNHGFVYLVSFIDEKNPMLLTKFYLSTLEVNTIKFSSLFGLYLVSLDSNQNFFVIHGQVGQKFNIISDFSYSDSDSIILNYSLHEIYNNNDENGIKICVLLTNAECDSKKSLSSNYLEILTLEKPNFGIVVQKIYLPDQYIKMKIINCDSNYLNIVGSRYTDRTIHFLRVQDDSMQIVSTIKTVHQLKHVLFYTQSKYLITWGNDRIVCVYNLDTLKLEISFLAGNYLDNEIKTVRCNNDGEYYLTLHSNGCLKCVRIEPNFKDDTSEINIKTKNFIQQNITKFKSDDNDDIDNTHEERTWLEIKTQKEYNDEVEKYRAKKDSILQDFLELKNKMKELIDNNEKEKPEYQISMQNFNLSPEQTESILELARRECDVEKRYLNAYIQDLERVKKWIIEVTWNRMDVKYSNLYGIFKDIECENYGLTYAQNEQNNDVKKVILLRSIELCTGKENVFRPWIPQTKGNLEVLSHEPSFTEVIAFTDNAINADTIQNENNKNENSLKNATSSSMIEFVNLCTYENLDNWNKSFVFSGTSTHNFVEPSRNRYRQVETVTFQQMFFEEILSNYDILNLRKWFNQKFQEMKYLKGEQIEEIKHKNERLRFVQNELNILARLLAEEEIDFEEIPDPTYRPEEEPNSIIKVEKHEVTVTPYVSPSMQKLIDEEALRKEQRRLALLADDFRERALIAMMDGVLEKRWEDEIKIDPELPECLKIQKNLDDYTKDDAKAVQEYNEKMNFIRSERKRYQKILKEERKRMKLLRDDQITKFNESCNELFSIKLRVDSAIKQEEIKFLRNQIFNLKRIQIKEKQNAIIKKLQDKKHKIEKLQKLIEELEKKLQDVQNRYEQLQARDKMLDKQFKMQFGEFAPSTIFETAYKIFKKRPKWIQRAWETNAILLDLANRILTRNTSKIGCPLPHECYDYLNSLNSNDNYSHAPNTIDQILWKSICRIRRQKIENEFKIKACGIQLIEAESTLNSYVRELNMKKNSYVSMNRELNELKKQYYEHLQNTALQIVLPLGLIEVPLTGHITDFNGTSLIKLSDIEDINIKIKKAGAIKLSVMNKLAIFRRKIIYQQWEHESLRLLLDRTKQKLKIIENIKVTVEMKACLIEMNRHRIRDLSPISLENELNLRRKVLQKYLDEMDEKIKNLKEKILIQKEENFIYDNRIQRINIEVNHQNLLRNVELEKHEINERKERMKMILERASLVRKIQAQHSHILELIAILELQRLRTFPTLTSIKNPIV